MITNCRGAQRNRGGLGGIVIIRKRLFSLLLTLALLLSCLCLTAAAANNEVSVTVDGQELDGAFLYEGTTLVPLRRFCELLSPDCQITWDCGTHTATVQAPGLEISAQSNSRYINANGRYLYTGDFGFVDEEGVFFLPVRVLAKAFGAFVAWNAVTRTVSILPGDSPIQDGDSFYDHDEVYWLSRIISAEARGENIDGQIAVGNVVMNRVVSPDFPETIYTVIFDNRLGFYQFSPVSNGSIYSTPAESSVIAAKMVLDGVQTAPDSLYFLNTATATSFWIVRNRSFVTTIGNHSFYA